MDCMEADYDKPFFTNYVTLLLCLILPKHSWRKKIAFGNKYYEVIKQKLSFFDLTMYRRFGTRKVRLSSQRTWWKY